MNKRLLLIALALPLIACNDEPAKQQPQVSQAAIMDVQAAEKGRGEGVIENVATGTGVAAEDIAAEVEEDKEMIGETQGADALKSGIGEVPDAGNTGEGEISPAIQGVFGELKGGVEVIEDKPAELAGEAASATPEQVMPSVPISK